MFKNLLSNNPMQDLREICGNCGLPLGSHHAGATPWPVNTCPATEHGMDFAQGPGTVFKPTGVYRDDKSCNNSKSSNSDN